MAKTPRIAVIGSANTDLTTFCDRFPQPGETIFGNSFDLGFGGKGANQAVAARLCGAEVLMVARVGHDLFGDATVRNFAWYGIDTTHVRKMEGVSSGVAPIFVDPSGQNSIIVVKGANDTLLRADVDAASAELCSADAIILQFEIPLETVYYVVEFAKKHGTRCIVNPAPAVTVDIGRLTTADYFVPNEREVAAITGRNAHSTAQAKDCCNFLRAKGFSKVIVTLGDRGCIFASHEGEPEIIPPFPVQPKDTTGAGDAFIGSFAVFLVEGLAEREALSRASLYAALSTTRIGTQKSFPKRAEFDAEWRRRTEEKP